MQWGIVSAACAVLGLIAHALSEWANSKTRAETADLKVFLITELGKLKTEICDRQDNESERTRGLVTPLGTEVARMGARLGSVEGEVQRLRALRPQRS